MFIPGYLYLDTYLLYLLFCLSMEISNWPSRNAVFCTQNRHNFKWGQRGVVKSNECCFVLQPNMFDLRIGCRGKRGGLSDLSHFSVTAMGAAEDGRAEIGKDRAGENSQSLIQSDPAFLSAKMSDDKLQHTHTHTRTHTPFEWGTQHDISPVLTGPESKEISVLASERRAAANGWFWYELLAKSC